MNINEARENTPLGGKYRRKGFNWSVTREVEGVRDLVQDANGKPMGRSLVLGNAIAEDWEPDISTARFEGPPDNARDCDRLTKKLKMIYDFLNSNGWVTLAEMERATGIPQASASAFARHLRKHRFGGHQIDKRRRSDGNQWEYSLKGNNQC